MTDNIDFDEFLEHVGGWGVFQWKLLGVLMFSTFVLSYVGYSAILYMYTPDHWCKIPENYTEILQISEKIDLIDLMIPIDESTMEKSKCYMYDPNSISDTFGNKSNWNKIKCIHGWQYNFTGYFTSISTDVSVYLFPRLLFLDVYSSSQKQSLSTVRQIWPDQFTPFKNVKR